MSILNRRSFLVISGASAVGLTRPQHGVAKSHGKRKMTIDLVCGAIGVGADQHKAIEYAAKYVFESVEPSAGEMAGFSDQQIEDTVASLKAKGLVWGAAGLTVDFRKDEATFKDGMKGLPRAAKALQTAGVTRVGTWLLPYHDSLTYVANFRQHAARLREVAKVFKDHGQRFGLEYVGPKTFWTKSNHSFIHTMAETKDLIAEIGTGNVGFVMDSWHWYTAGETIEDLKTLTNDDIVACDLNDAPAGIERDQQMDLRRELPATTGVIDLKTFLNALNDIGYDGPVRAEPFNRTLNAMAPERALPATAAAMRRAFKLIEG